MHKICGLRQEKTRQWLEIRFVSLDFAVNNQSYSQATGRFSRQSRVWSSLRTDGLLFYYLNREGRLKGDGGRWTALGRSRIIQTKSIFIWIGNLSENYNKVKGWRNSSHQTWFKNASWRYSIYLDVSCPETEPIWGVWLREWSLFRLPGFLWRLFKVSSLLADSESLWRREGTEVQVSLIKILW